MASSDYAVEISSACGRERHLLTLHLKYDTTQGKLVEAAMQPDMFHRFRSRLHADLDIGQPWSLPPLSTMARGQDCPHLQLALLAIACASLPPARPGHSADWAGPDWVTPGLSAGNLPIIMACRFNFVRPVACLLALDKAHATRYTDNAGMTPLMVCAVRPERHMLLHFLLKNGADPNARHAKFGWTALHQAVTFGHRLNAEVLLAAGTSSPMIHAFVAGFVVDAPRSTYSGFR